MKVAVIPADPAQQIRFEDIEISLDAVQERVAGDIEAVRLGQDEMTMYLNEEGKLQGLLYNQRATLLAHGAEAISPSDWIAGDAVLCGPMDDEGYDTALTEEHVQALTLFGQDYQEAVKAFLARAGHDSGEGR